MAILDQIIQLTESIPMGTRDRWDEYFLGQAYITSLRSSCGSRRVGAVIVCNHRMIASGYNGNPPGSEHCIDGGCPRFEAKKKGLLQSGEYPSDAPCLAFHAEENCIYQLAKSGIQKGSTDEWIIYSTTAPCRSCAKMINGAGITKVFYHEGYPDEFSLAYFQKFGIVVEKI